MRRIYHSIASVLMLAAASPAMAQSKAEVVGHLGVVHVSGSKPIFGANGDSDGIMFKASGLGSWKDVLLTANLDGDMPDGQRDTISNYQSPKTVYVTCNAVTIVRLVGKTTNPMGKGDHCTIDRITTP